ncbi:MAG: MSMEG_4193 family putative phosphomutase [Nocardioides sp.]
MAIVVLLRHGRTTANASGVLAGRADGVHLDAHGRDQARRAGARLAAVPLAALVTSPLARCLETAGAVAAAQPSGAADHRPAPAVERGLIECDYGQWQGRVLKDLAKDKLWATVQHQPSAVRFPGGESMREMQARAVEAVRAQDAVVEDSSGPDAAWLAVSHGDLIKSVLADALGMHLDLFQRIHVDPASISIIRFTSTRPSVLAMNTHDGDLSWLATPGDRRRGSRTSRSADAVVGGGAGPGRH